MSNVKSRWRSDGVRIVRAADLDANTPQTPGMQRRAAVTTASTGAKQLWAGTVAIDANAKTGAHPGGDPGTRALGRRPTQMTSAAGDARFTRR
jgi:uncharacterized RmlC-like cupin family protein